MQDPGEPDLVAFYGMFYPRLVAALGLAAADLAEAEDAAQEAFARLLRTGRWGALSSPEAWLYTVGMNVLRRRWRRMGRDRDRRVVSVASGPGWSDSEQAAQRVDLHRAIGSLPARYRAPLVMFYLLDLPLAQIAEQTGTSVGTVKSQLSRGRELLARRLGEVTAS